MAAAVETAPRRAEAIVGMTIGLAVGGLGVWQLAAGGLRGVALITLGVGVFLVFAFYERIESLKVTASGVAATLVKREHGRELVEAAANAPDSALAAVMPLLREDVASDVVSVPAIYDGKRLIDEELQFLRKDLNVTVFALRRPGDAKWCGGGRVSTTVLAAGTDLAVIGEPGDLGHLRRRFGESLTGRAG